MLRLSFSDIDSKSCSLGEVSEALGKCPLQRDFIIAEVNYIHVCYYKRSVFESEARICLSFS